MTHEMKPGDEIGGPEQDASLPDAASIPGALSAVDSDGDDLDGDLEPPEDWSLPDWLTDAPAGGES